MPDETICDVNLYEPDAVERLVALGYGDVGYVTNYVTNCLNNGHSRVGGCEQQPDDIDARPPGEQRGIGPYPNRDDPWSSKVSNVGSRPRNRA